MTYDESSTAIRHSSAAVSDEPAPAGSIATRKKWRRANGKGTAGGAPEGNHNATLHGLTRTSALALGRLPPGCGHIASQVAELRRALESAVVERHGQISLRRALQIQTATRWETVSRLASRWLRLASDTMDASTKLAFASQVAKASTERDRVLASLGIDERDDDFFSTLYAKPLPLVDEPVEVEPVDTFTAHPTPPAPADENAAEATCGPHSGGSETDEASQGGDGR